MSNLTYVDYEPWGPFVNKLLGYHQAVRVGDRIECSGQGGWTVTDKGPEFSSNLEEEIDKAFQNVDACLKAAGGTGWDQVFRLNSYHLDLNEQVGPIMKKCFEKYMPKHQCIWTEVGVRQLGAPGMNVELEVSAYVG